MIEDLNKLQNIKNTLKQTDSNFISMDIKIKILTLAVNRKKILIHHLSKLYQEYQPFLLNDIKQIKNDFYQN
jgi:hypothetical protein